MQPKSNLLRRLREWGFFNRNHPISEAESRDIKRMLTKLVNMETIRMSDFSRIFSEVQAIKDMFKAFVASGVNANAKIAELTEKNEILVGVKAALEAKAVEDQAMLDTLAAELAALRDVGASTGGIV